MSRKRLHAIFLTLAIVLPASQPIFSSSGPQLVGSPAVTYLSYSYVRLAWQTDIPSSGVVLYGVTTAYGQVTPAPGNYYATNLGFDPQHSWFISGLAPATTFHYCIQSTDQSGNTSVCNGTTNDFTFTTPAAPNPVPQPPQAPLSIVDTSEPTQTGVVRTVTAANNCSDPSTGLQATLNAANPGDTVVIPHGTVCDGVYLFPAKTSGSGWIVVKSDGALPPDGTRITPSYQSQMATIRTARPAIGFGYAADIPNGLCYGGVLIQEIEARGLRPGLHTCIASQGHYSSALPYTTGSTVPTACTEGDLFYDTATAGQLPYESTYQCVNDNGATHFVLLDQNYDGPYQDTAAIQFAPGANHYRLIGLEVTFPPVPSTYITLGGGIYYGSLISTPTSSSNIVLDRLYIHGQPFPAEGPNGAIYFDGANQALINSYLDEIAYWLLTTTSIPEHVVSAIVLDNGPGPGKIQNNYISAIGITFYVAEPYTTTSTIPSDYQVFGNYFYKDDKYRLGSPTNLSLEGGRSYSNRHFFELKQGHRWSVQGNIFSGNFSFINQGAAVALTSSPADTGTTVTNDMQVSDVAFVSNIITNCAQGFVFAGTYIASTTNGSTGLTPSPKTISRLKLTNNLFYQLDSSLVTNPPALLTRASAIPLGSAFGMEDLSYTHNTSYCNTRQDGALANFFAAPIAGAGLLLNDNVACFGPNSTAGPGVTGEGDSGAAALSTYWQNYPSPLPAWQFSHNVLYGDPTPALQPGSGSPYPAGNYWPSSDTAVSFNNAPAMDLSLSASSPYRGFASDGRDPGVDMVQLTAQTVSTLSGINYVPPVSTPPVISGITVSNLSQTGATVSWNTDTNSDSLVQFGLSPSYGSFSTWNSALGTTHSVTLANLTAGMSYHYQVRSSDAAGNPAASADQVLTTQSNLAANVSGQVSVSQTGFARNHASGLWVSTMTVKNTGGSNIAGPIQVLLTNITTGDTMTNSTGTYSGSPYITVSTGALAPGASASVSIQFNNPSNAFISYTPLTYSGIL